MEKGLSWVKAWEYTIQYMVPMALAGFLYMMGIGILLENDDDIVFCGGCFLMLSLMLSITMIYKLITDGVTTALIYNAEIERENQKKGPTPTKSKSKPKSGPPPAKPEPKPKKGPPPAKPESKPKAGPPPNGN